MFRYVGCLVADAKGNYFMLRDITIENTAGKEAGAAVALRSDSKQSVFYRCEFIGYEDTLLAKTGRQFYRECTISGTVDFIFGNAKAVFQNCLLLARRPLAGKHNVVTAQGKDGGRSDAGFAFQNCTVTSHEVLDGAETYLGRPWKKHSHVVFLQSFMDTIVHPRLHAYTNCLFFLATRSALINLGYYIAVMHVLLTTLNEYEPQGLGCVGQSRRARPLYGVLWRVRQ
jgi:pectinesterase